MQGFTSITNYLFAGKIPRLYLFLCIVASFIFNDARLISMIYQRGSIPLLFLIFGYVVAFFSISSMILNKNALIRKLSQVLLFSSIYTDILYLILSDFPFSYPDAINLFNNTGHASGAFITFKVAFLLAFAGTGIGYTLIHLSIKNVNVSYAPAWILLFITMQVSLYLYSKQYPGIHDFFPFMYRVTGNLLSANSFSPEEQWRRAGVNEKPGKINVKHLFVVVDESVTGNTLSINGFPLPTSPFLQSNVEKFINFGTATSFTNFSAGSNLSLMSGMLLSELPDKKYISFSKANIFQYAKKAGYQTYLMDAQSDNKTLQNYTTPQDLFFIDSLIQPGVIYPSFASHSRDSMIAEEIAVIAKMEVPTFVYVNKAGAHWPYNANFPSDSLSNYFSTPAYPKKNAIMYFESLSWSVDKFWEKLINLLPENNDVLILYTSDHGENYASESYEIKHASIYKTHAVEGLVPLLVFDQANFFPKNYHPPLNRYSHQYVFPTLLSAMGYDRNFITTTYGRTLLELPYPQPRWFQTGDLFGRGKNKQIFVDEKQK